MLIGIGRILSPVQSLGPGRRLVLWLQGCSRASAGTPCKGCISRDLWPAIGGHWFETAELARAIVNRMGDEQLTGLTVTGGEPLDQYSQLVELLEEVERLREARSAPSADETTDSLLFTFHSYDEVCERYPLVTRHFDAMVCGEYRQDMPSDRPLVASANQELVTNDRVVSLYSDMDKQPRLQVLVDGQDMVFAGIPLPGDIERVEEGLRARGVCFAQVSWKE